MSVWFVGVDVLVSNCDDGVFMSEVLMFSSI